MEPITNDYVTTDRQRIRLDALNLAAGVQRENGDSSSEAVLATAEKFVTFIEAGKL